MKMPLGGKELSYRTVVLLSHTGFAKYFRLWSQCPSFPVFSLVVTTYVDCRLVDKVVSYIHVHYKIRSPAPWNIFHGNHKPTIKLNAFEIRLEDLDNHYSIFEWRTSTLFWEHKANDRRHMKSTPLQGNLGEKYICCLFLSINRG